MAGSGQDLDVALGAARRGDEAGLSAVYGLLGGRVAEFLRARGAWDADGLTNEVFLAAFTGMAEFRGDADAFRGWVYTIARNKAIDDARKRARRPEVVAGDAEPLTVPSRHVVDDVFVHIEREWIAEQLSDLTADQRDVVVLRLIDDLSVRDVAEILDKPEEAVRSLQYRAIRQLRKKLVGDPPRPPRSVR